MEVTPKRGSQGSQYPSVILLPPLTCWGAPQCPQKPSGHRSHAIHGDQPPGAPELWAQKAENGQRPGGAAGRCQTRMDSTRLTAGRPARCHATLSPIGSRHFNRPTLNTHRGEELGGNAGCAEPIPGHWRPRIPGALEATAPASVAWGGTHVVGLQQSVSGSPRAPSPTIQRAALHTCLGLPRTRLCPLRGGPSPQELRAGTPSEGSSGLLFLSCYGEQMQPGNPGPQVAERWTPHHRRKAKLPWFPWHRSGFGVWPRQPRRAKPMTSVPVGRTAGRGPHRTGLAGQCPVVA